MAIRRAEVVAKVERRALMRGRKERASRLVVRMSGTSLQAGGREGLEESSI
ncbi:hypothetical protein IU459_10265 [Nocardia amamiensis]|uniref:Uncharacterized protein n=1 Tax=Nocardia amamiensis TaxID=404578 RepID=A0ABS0CMY4_9NOCA|nr:hypothetical protein [Nocardia amamiensis]MBF6297930.1 hypothetical protein [Nocardia amamiensis]